MPSGSSLCQSLQIDDRGWPRGRGGKRRAGLEPLGEAATPPLPICPGKSDRKTCIDKSLNGAPTPVQKGGAQLVLVADTLNFVESFSLSLGVFVPEVSIQKNMLLHSKRYTKVSNIIL